MQIDLEEHYRIDTADCPKVRFHAWAHTAIMAMTMLSFGVCAFLDKTASQTQSA